MRDPKALLTCDLDDDEDEDSLDETLSWGDTLLFPVIGSITLMGLFLIIKYAGTKWINLVLGVYRQCFLVRLKGGCLWIRRLSADGAVSGAGMFAIHSVSCSTELARILADAPPDFLDYYRIHLPKDRHQAVDIPHPHHQGHQA